MDDIRLCTISSHFFYSGNPSQGGKSTKLRLITQADNIIELCGAKMYSGFIEYGAAN